VHVVACRDRLWSPVRISALHSLVICVFGGLPLTFSSFIPFINTLPFYFDMISRTEKLVILLVLVLAPTATDTSPTSRWTGPSIKPVFNPAGISAFSINGQTSAPSFLVGNTQGQSVVVGDRSLSEKCGERRAVLEM
jgi:hypothetical protein